MYLRLALHALWALALVFGPGVAAGVFWWRAQSEARALAEQGSTASAVITEVSHGERPQGGGTSARTQAVCRASFAFDAVGEDGIARPMTVSGEVPCRTLGAVGQATSLVYLPSDPEVFEAVRGQRAATARSRAWYLALVGLFYAALVLGLVRVRAKMRRRAGLKRDSVAAKGA